MIKAERARVRQIKTENALNSDLAEEEERQQRADIEGEEHVRFLGEKLRKVKDYWANHEVEVRGMDTKTNKSLEDLRVDIVRFLPD